MCAPLIIRRCSQYGARGARVIPGQASDSPDPVPPPNADRRVETPRAGRQGTGPRRPVAGSSTGLEICVPADVCPTARVLSDPRAARRYVRILREAEIPIESTRGPHGGYRTGRRLRLAPLMLTGSEALGLVMAMLEGPHGTGTTTTPSTRSRPLWARSSGSSPRRSPPPPTPSGTAASGERGQIVGSPEIRSAAELMTRRVLAAPKPENLHQPAVAPRQERGRIASTSGR